MAKVIKFTVLVDSLNIRKGAGTSFAVTGTLSKGYQGTASSAITDTSGKTWLKLGDTKWVCQKGAEEYCKIDKVILDDSSNNSKDVPNPNGGTENAQNKATTAGTVNAGSGVADKYYELYTKRKSNTANRLDGSDRLFGLPHQFLEENDARINDISKLGRVFTETMVLDAPMVFFKPGTTEFLEGATKKEKSAIVKAIEEIGKGVDNASEVLTRILSESSDNIKYFDFKPAFGDYMSRVNMLCRVCAIFLNVQHIEVPWCKGVSFGKYDWRYYKFNSTYVSTTPELLPARKKGAANGFDAFLDTMKNTVNGIIDDKNYVQFYVDGGTSFSESASNSTGQSIIDSSIDKVEGIAKELSILSEISGENLNSLSSDIVGGIDGFLQNNFGDGAIINTLRSLTQNGKQILAGGNFRLPEVWQNSEYTKSYSLTINLNTPYGNMISWYLNICVPLMHIIAMALPHQLSANTYKQPYFIKAFEPGRWSCNFGMIDSISIEKGGSGDSWSMSGLPTEVKVSISIKDLYSSLAIPAKYKPGAFTQNTGLVEFLMTTCAMDLSKPELSDKIDIYKSLFLGSISESITRNTTDVMAQFKENISGMFKLLK